MTIKFKIDGVEYCTPEYINLAQYAKIFKIKDFFEDQYLAAKLINIICGVPLNDALECPFEEINFIASNILSKFPSNQNNKDFIDQFEIDGIKYGFFPSWRELTFAEFVDMDTISTKKTEELVDMLHILAAIMYRPIVEQISEHNYKIEDYDIKTMKLRAELFKKKLDIKIILSAQFFFIKLEKKFLEYSQPFSPMTMKMSLWNMIKTTWILTRMVTKTTSKKDMDGSLSLTKLLTTILVNTNTSIKRN